MSDESPQLYIDRNSWHFRYFLFIRHFWGFKDAPSRTSLCPYCQTMFWFSIAAVVLAPLMVIGWVLLKIGRMAYKMMDAIGFEKLIDSIDGSPFGKWLDVSDNSMMDSPGPTALITLIVTSLTLGVPGAILFALFTFCLYLYANRGHIPGALADFCIHLGVFAFDIFYCIGYCVHWTWHGIAWLGSGLAWFFTYTPFWYSAFYWMAVFLGMACFSFVCCYLVYIISRTKIGLAIWDYIIFRLNGYGEARKRAKIRQEARQEVLRIERESLPPKGPGMCSRFLTYLKEKIFGKKGEFAAATGDKAGQILTTVGVAWEWIKGMKRNACPIIEFVEPVAEKEKNTENT